jgi:hypothetical protein
MPVRELRGVESRVVLGTWVYATDGMSTTRAPSHSSRYGDWYARSLQTKENSEYLAIRAKRACRDSSTAIARAASLLVRPRPAEA